MKNYEAFCNDYIDEIYKNYKLNGFKYNPKERNLTNVLADYISVLITKLVTEVPREIKISKELEAKIANDENLKDNIDFMVNKIKNGENINGHLTRKIYNTTDNDKLFSEWGIKHIHLNKKEANTNEEMANNRKGDLLFCVFTKDTCYLLDALLHDEHNVFALINYLRIMKNNWPGIFLEECVDSHYSWAPKTDEEIVKLRESNINVMAYEIDGKQYIKKNLDGLTVAGTNLNTKLLAIDMIKKIENIDGEYENIKFNFLSNDFGDIKCKNGTYNLGLLYQK